MQATENLFRIYCNKVGLDPNESFPGIKMDDLEAACSIFNVEVLIYTTDPKHYSSLIWRSETHYDKILNLDCSKGHFSLITDLDTYSQSYRYVNYRFFLLLLCLRVETSGSRLKQPKSKKLVTVRSVKSW